MTRFISDRPAAKTQVASLQKQVQILKQDPDNLKSKYVDLEVSYSRLSQKFRNLVDEKEQIESSLNKFKTDSKDVTGLSDKAKRLEKQVEQLIIQMDDMRIQNEALKDSSIKKAWLTGAMIAFFGVLLGWIFSKTGSRRQGW